MNRYFLTATHLFLCLTLSTFATAEVYKTVDKNGRITYSDTPPPNTNAKPIELKPINTLPPTSLSPTQNIINGPTGAAQEAPNYSIRIAAPENGTTLMPDERSTSISVSLTPNLQEGDLLAYKLDGTVIEKTTELSVTLAEPPRGEHSITVEVVNSDNKSLAQSDAVTLVVMRPLVKQTATPTPKK